MAASSGEGQLTGVQAVVEEMTKIRKSAARLEGFLPADNSTARAVFEELTGSISRAISLLDAQGLDAGHVIGSPSSGDKKGENSGGKRQIIPGDFRGGYRRKSQALSCRIATSKTSDDGQTWRKYGQKLIHSSKYPRSYFRCTHKYDQGCKALKQVQRSEEDPSTYRITYMGEHTCTDPAMASHFISPTSNLNNSCLISFAAPSTSVVPSQEATPALASLSSVMRKEYDDEVLSNLTCGSSSWEYSHVLPAGETPPMIIPVLGPTTTSEHGDVSSEFQSPASSMDLDFMTDSLGFDQTEFLFDHDDFFS